MANGNDELNEALLETEAVLNGEAHAPQSAFAAVAAVPDIPREKQPRRPRHTTIGGRHHTPAWHRARMITAVCSNLAIIMERTDEQILPAVYNFIGRTFDATPSQLGALTLSRAFAQAITSPLGGVLGHYLNRMWVVSFGCILWGVMTAAFSAAPSLNFWSMLVWSVTGLGLALVIPNVQSVIADFFAEKNRGKAFGLLQMTSLLGGSLGALYATNLGGARPFGYEGWRFAFFSVAMLSIIIGVVNFLFSRDPRYVNDGCCGPRSRSAAKAAVGIKTRRLPPDLALIGGPDAAAGTDPAAAMVVEPEEGGGLSFYSTLVEIQTVMSIPSFLIIIVQGIVGTIPSSALAFLTLYLQLLGMSDFHASVCTALFLAGQAFGGPIGGYLGDKAANRFPNHGRIVVCQFSVASGIPFTILVLKVLPALSYPNVVTMYGVVLTVMGMFIAWPAPACNNPVFAEIVPPPMRNMVYAFDRSFEGALAACGAPLVGYLAQHWFGFSGSATAGGPHDRENAHALSNALMVMTIVPWAFCCICYSGLHFTYPKDKHVAMAEIQRTITRRLSRLPSRYPTLDLDDAQQVRVSINVADSDSENSEIMLSLDTETSIEQPLLDALADSQPEDPRLRGASRTPVGTFRRR